MKNLFDPIRFRTYINVPPSVVFKTITTGKGWDSWFTSGTEIDLEKGVIFFLWQDLGPDKIKAEETAQIVEVRENELFSFSWHTEAFQTPTLVTMTLEQKDVGTILTVTDEGYPRTKEGENLYMECAAGWGEGMTLLKVYLESGYRYINWQNDADIESEAEERNYPM